MKLHEVKKDTPIYVAKKVAGLPLDKQKFVKYRTKEAKTYFAEQCKEIEANMFNKSAIWNPKGAVGIYSQLAYINLNGEKTQIGIKTIGYHSQYIVIEQDGYIALVEPFYIKFYCNIPQDY